MLYKVFYDFRYFLPFFGMVIGAFTVILQILLKKSNETYDGIRPIAFYVLALRQSIGDYDTSTLIEGSNEDFKNLVWILWFFIMIVGNIVFMNFIIAVVSESYENCMERMVQSIQSAKLEMIEECENLLPQRFFTEDNFPKYILVRRPVEDEGSADSEWQGFVNQMKKHFEKETLIIKTEFDKQRKSITEVKAKLDKFDKLEAKLETLEASNTEIKASIA
jgi:hypothetical protein